MANNIEQKKRDKSMLTLKNIGKSFGNQIVLKSINLSIFEREVIALIGKNGSGKSTLLKIMAGILQPDEGRVENPSGIKVAYFPQEIPLEGQNRSVREVLASTMNIKPEKVYGKVASLFGKLGFPKEKLDSRVELLSGGEKSKVLLALILASNTEIFLLDEPTNNLDLEGLILLEDFIMSSPCGFLIVSHDRKFLERLATGIVELDSQKHGVKKYSHCRYGAYLEEKKRKEEKEIAAYQDYSEEKRGLESTIRERKQRAQEMQRGPKKQIDHDKFVVGFKKDRSKKIAGQAASLEKTLERLDEVERPKFHLPLNLEFLFSERSGDVVFRLEGAEIEYNYLHFGPVDFSVNYKDRIVILGPNGGGKSTLLQIVVQKIKPANGQLQIGSKVKIGYLPQETIFEQKETILDYFFKQAKMEESNARRILARFGFFAENVKTEATKLSPGERSRLILAALMAQNVNCLILDEPTNHLDPEAIDRLEAALKSFAGTIVLVSHDRYLIDQVGATRTYLMEDGKLSFIKDYHEYENKVLSRK